MGLRDWIWPFDGGTENSSDEDAGQEGEAGIDAAPREMKDQENTVEATGMDSQNLDGVMESIGVDDASEGRTVLGTDQSTELDDENQVDHDEIDFYQFDDDSGESGKSVDDLLSEDLGEEPLTMEDSETKKSQGGVENQGRNKSTSEDDSGHPDDETDFNPDILRSSTPGDGTRHGENDNTFMELPEVCVTEQESPDPDASPKEMLPEVLPGWDFQKEDRYRVQMENAEDYINATYRDQKKRRYMIHVSKWKPSHVKYALDELYGFREPHPFDVWTARGQFVFAVKIVSGTVSNAHTLLMACPALSKSYFQFEEGS
jgi:hypothetical protein